MHYIYYCNLGEYHKDDNQSITAWDLTVRRSAQPLQNEQQRSKICDAKAKNGSSRKHASASDFWQVAFPSLSIFLLAGS